MAQATHLPDVGRRPGAGPEPVASAGDAAGSARPSLAAVGRAGETGLPVSVLTASDVTAFLAGMACIHAPGTPAASSLLICWLLARRLGCLQVVPSSPATPYSQYLARRLDR
jgi:hypothetical protein